MDLVYFKVAVLLNCWLWAGGDGAPLAMLQHATSSQSIVFHQPQGTSSPGAVAGSSPINQYGGSQPSYEYKYEVSDHQTGDRKSHWESREGDTVRGVYTLYEPDGALRTVEYTADAIHGFNAVVRRDEPNNHHRPRQHDTYNRASSANSANDGYDTSASSPRYTSERGSFQGGNQGTDYSRNSVPGTGYIPRVGFRVSHDDEWKKQGENSIKPY